MPNKGPATHSDGGEDLFDLVGLAAEHVGHDEGEQRHEFHQVVLQWRPRQHQAPLSLQVENAHGVAIKKLAM